MLFFAIKIVSLRIDLSDMQNREQKIRNITLWGSFVNILLTAGKICAGVFGKSAAMIADGFHSLSDLVSDFVVLIFSHFASKKTDRHHPFGHGKFETMGTIIVSILLMVVGASLLSGGVKSIVGFIHGEDIPRPGWIALVAASVSIAAKELLFRATMKVGNEVDSPVTRANAWHHRSDAFSSIGALIGIGGAFLLGEKWTVLDPIVSCGISIAIIVLGVKMSLPALSELLESSLPEDVQAEIVKMAQSVEGVKDIHNLKTRKNGVAYIIEAHVVVDPQMSVYDAHEIATQIEDKLYEKYGSETQISIHIEPDTASR